MLHKNPSFLYFFLLHLSLSSRTSSSCSFHCKIEEPRFVFFFPLHFLIKLLLLCSQFMQFFVFNFVMCGFDHFLCIVGFILGDCLSGYLIFERFLSFGFFKFMWKIKMDSVLLPYSRLVFLFFFLHFEIFLSLTAFSIDSMFFLFVLTRFMF